MSQFLFFFPPFVGIWKAIKRKQCCYSANPIIVRFLFVFYIFSQAKGRARLRMKKKSLDSFLFVSLFVLRVLLRTIAWLHYSFLVLLSCWCCYIYSGLCMCVCVCIYFQPSKRRAACQLRTSAIIPSLLSFFFYLFLFFYILSLNASHAKSSARVTWQASNSTTRAQLNSFFFFFFFFSSLDK